MRSTPNGPKRTGLTRDGCLAVEMLYRAFSAGKPELLDPAVPPDRQDDPFASHHEPGREGMKPLIRGFVAAFSDLEITIHEITGTYKGEWFGITPVSKAFGIPLHELRSIENGQVMHGEVV